MAIFSQFFFVLAIKFLRMNLLQNRFHRWSTFWAYFPGTSIKVKLTAIIGWAITPIMTIFAIMGVMAHSNYGHNVDLSGCHWKIWPKCRSPVKKVLKKIHPIEFYGRNKKNWEKMAIFRRFPLYFCPKLQTGGHRPRKVEKFWDFLGDSWGKPTAMVNSP